MSYFSSRERERERQKLKILSNPRTCGDVRRKGLECGGGMPDSILFIMSIVYLFRGISVPFVDCLFPWLRIMTDISGMRLSHI